MIKKKLKSPRPPSSLLSLSDDYNAKKMNMKHLKSLAFEVDVAKKDEKDSQTQFAKFESRPGKAGEDVTQKLAELKEKAVQVDIE